MLYPASGSERDRWILDQRPPRTDGDPRRPYAFFSERERSAAGTVVTVATVFLTNRECPWRCLMCDLWKNTLPDTVPSGAIVEQIDYALTRLDTAAQIKLYNSGSFFDRHAIPPEDYERIAARIAHFENVIVESHPALIGEATLRFRDLLDGRLEVAMGLETADEVVLAKLNKRMTLAQFRSAASVLKENEIALRAFILVKPPFTEEAEALDGAKRSIDVAFECGATAVTLIPVRAGNGAMEALQRAGHFDPPRLETVEEAFEYGLMIGRGRVFADVWDLARRGDDCCCRVARVDRLARMNLEQQFAERVTCSGCLSTMSLL